MMKLPLIKVIALKDYYFNEKLVRSSIELNRLVLLSRGKGMMYVSAGRQVHVKQFNDGWMLMWRDELWSSCLYSDPCGFKVCLLRSDPQPAFIPVPRFLEKELWEQLDRLRIGLVVTNAVELIRPLIEPLLQYVVESYAAERHAIDCLEGLKLGLEN